MEEKDSNWTASVGALIQMKSMTPSGRWESKTQNEGAIIQGVEQNSKWEGNTPSRKQNSEWWARLHGGDQDFKWQSKISSGRERLKLWEEDFKWGGRNTASGRALIQVGDGRAKLKMGEQYSK